MGWAARANKRKAAEPVPESQATAPEGEHRPVPVHTIGRRPALMASMLGAMAAMAVEPVPSFRPPVIKDPKGHKNWGRRTKR